MPKVRHAVGLLLLCSGPIAHAQEVVVPEVQAVESKEMEDLVTMQVAAAAKIYQPLREAPGVLTALTREQIQTYGYISLNDILYKQPGFTPAQDYDRRTVAARGLFEGWNNNHLLLLIDGIPHNDHQYGTAFTWEVTPLFMVKSLEIIRGPGSALYGSNATNGVIAINTRSASNLEAPAEGQVRIGNGGTQIYDVVGGQEFKHLSFLVGYNHYQTDGNSYLSYDGSGRRDGDGNLLQFQTQDKRRSDYALLKIEGNGRLRGLQLQVHYQSWQFGTGHGWLWSIPDVPERLAENRQLVSLSYRTPNAWRGKLLQEYAIRYQRHAIDDWHIQFYPTGYAVSATDPATMETTTTNYPDGLVETLDTQTHDVFMRAQYTYLIRPGMSLIAGVEDTVFIYGGDKVHSSNVDLTTTFAPWNPPGVRALGPWFEWVKNKPVNNVGVFAQYLSGKFARNIMSVAAGVRLDAQTFNYVDISDPARATKDRSFFAVSPRLALMLYPAKILALKLIAERAFRAPAPSELFGANTFTLASNIGKLQPETITTATLAVDLTINRHLILRTNGFYERFENQIAYSVANANLSSNVYTRDVVGLESELLAELEIPKIKGGFGGFANYTYVNLIGEDVADATLTAHPGRLTWAPSHSFNLGLNIHGHGISLAAQMHYQGAVDRRDSDLRIDENRTLRPDRVGGWVTFDARLSYQPTSWVRLGVQGSNLFNASGRLTKNNDYSFDYRIEPMRIMGTLEILVKPI